MNSTESKLGQNRLSAPSAQPAGLAARPGRAPRAPPLNASPAPHLLSRLRALVPCTHAAYAPARPCRLRAHASCPPVRPCLLLARLRAPRAPCERRARPARATRAPPCRGLAAICVTIQPPACSFSGHNTPRCIAIQNPRCQPFSVTIQCCVLRYTAPYCQPPLLQYNVIS